MANSNSRRTRLTGIDGLKGLAILAVLITHIPLGVWLNISPNSAHWLVLWIANGGGVGVTIFFIVTGFLMGLLYPAPRSALSFYSRRYARLFPAFLVMVISFTFIRLFRIPMYAQVPTVLVCITLFHFLRKRFSQHGQSFIYLFLTLQLLVAFLYVFFLQKIPSQVFYMDWHPTLQTIIGFFINATLTLPLGNFIGQFDGIYWALCAELLFYIAYPIFVVPLMHRIQNRSSKRRLLLLFILFLPFCFGLMSVSQRILAFGTLQLHLIVYFIVGVFIGMHTVQIKKLTSRFHSLLTQPAWIAGMIVIVFSSVQLAGYLSKYFQYWLNIVMVIPTAILLITAFVTSEQGKTILQSPVLTKLGKFSYAIFLTHSLVIHTVQEYISYKTSLGALQFAVLSVVGTFVLSWILYRFAEHPYFLARKSTSESTNDRTKYTSTFVHRKMIGFLVFIAAILYIAYRPPVSLFTYVYRHEVSKVPITGDDSVTLSTKPFRQTFVAKENSLGMVTSHIRNEKIEGMEGGFVLFKLKVRLLDDKNTVISESTYNAYEIMDDPFFPFGFPIQTTSKRKAHSIEYQLSEMSPSRDLKIIKNEADLLSVYFVDKKILLTNPLEGGRWLVHKVTEPLANLMFLATFLHIAPFLWVLFLENKKYPLRGVD